VPAKRLFWVLVACLAVWAAFIPSRGVWAPDEARYAEVTREMALGNDWLIPELNGELYAQKPPLFFDLARLVSLPAESVHAWAVKVPSLVAAALSLLLVGLLGLRLMGPQGAWLAPLLLGTMFKFAWQAQFGQIDMVLTGLVVAQIYLGLRTSSGQTPRLRGIMVLSLLGAAGVLAKGPVGCLLPWFILVAYLAIRRDWPSLRRLGLPWIISLVLALTAFWLLLAGLVEGWHYPEALVFHQSVQRYFEPWHHKAPFYYYLGVLFTDGLPYSLLLVPMAAHLIRRRTWKEPGALLPLVWMAVYLLFFSLSEGKRSVYILPMFPGMALLLAYGILNVHLERWPVKGFKRAFLALGALFLGLGIYGIANIPVHYRAMCLPIAAGAVALSSGCLAALLFTERKRILTGVVWMACSSLLFLLLTGIPVVRALDPVKAPLDLAAKLKPAIAAGGTLAVFPTLVPSVNFYTRSTTPVFSRGEEGVAVRFLHEGRRRLLLARKDAWRIRPAPHDITRLGETRIGNDIYLLLGPSENDPARGQGASAEKETRGGGQTSEGLGR